MRRNTKFFELSGQLVDYLVESNRMTQSDVAAALDVDKSFISRVRSRQREFSPTQMERLADHLGVPLGALLIEVVEPRKQLTPERKELVDLCKRVMQTADEARAQLKAGSAVARP
jgi:transcriptional regulator with XRE-family HTH domain